MSNSFRIDETELRGWHGALAARMDVRGVPAIAKEIEAHLARKEADGSVVVSRHQLFTWAEALAGAAARESGQALGPVVADMRAILAGKPQGAPAAQPAAAAPTPPAPAPAPYAPAPVTYSPPPPVVYGAPAGAAPVAAGSVRLVSGVELAATVRELVRGARSELLVSSPWDTGLETLLPEITMVAPNVRILAVSRRPAQESAAYHQGMNEMGKRRAVTAFSPHIQTRMIVVDGERALVGAASIPGPASREAGILLTDRAAVAAVRAHFEHIHREAAGPAR